MDNSFVSPELHYEPCTRVEYQPGLAKGAEVTYVGNETDLSDAISLAFWVHGGSDGERI